MKLRQFSYARTANNGIKADAPLTLDIDKYIGHEELYWSDGRSAGILIHMVGGSSFTVAGDDEFILARLK